MDNPLARAMRIAAFISSDNGASAAARGGNVGHTPPLPPRPPLPPQPSPQLPPQPQGWVPAMNTIEDRNSIAPGNMFGRSRPYTSVSRSGHVSKEGEDTLGWTVDGRPGLNSVGQAASRVATAARPSFYSATVGPPPVGAPPVGPRAIGAPRAGPPPVGQPPTWPPPGPLPLQSSQGQPPKGPLPIMLPPVLVPVGPLSWGDVSSASPNKLNSGMKRPADKPPGSNQGRHNTDIVGGNGKKPRKHTPCPACRKIFVDLSAMESHLINKKDDRHVAAVRNRSQRGRVGSSSQGRDRRDDPLRDRGRDSRTLEAPYAAITDEPGTRKRSREMSRSADETQEQFATASFVSTAVEVEPQKKTLKSLLSGFISGKKTPSSQKKSQSAPNVPVKAVVDKKEEATAQRSDVEHGELVPREVGSGEGTNEDEVDARVMVEGPDEVTAREPNTREEVTSSDVLKRSSEAPGPNIDNSCNRAATQEPPQVPSQLQSAEKFLDGSLSEKHRKGEKLTAENHPKVPEEDEAALAQSSDGGTERSSPVLSGSEKHEIDSATGDMRGNRVEEEGIGANGNLSMYNEVKIQASRGEDGLSDDLFGVQPSWFEIIALKKERDAALKAAEAMEIERNAAVQERDEMVTKLHLAYTQRDEMALQRDGALKEKGALESSVTERMTATL